MPVQVYRCSHCGREVLVRDDTDSGGRGMSDAEIARRIEEEMRPPAQGRPGRADVSTRLRDDIWLGISSTREIIPRDELPSACPACGKATLAEDRLLG
jgi:predicted RNA-binding Zn-ribbon protein involved in translation (DUF1610 family)